MQKKFVDELAVDIQRKNVVQSKQSIVIGTFFESFSSHYTAPEKTNHPKVDMFLNE